LVKNGERVEASFNSVEKVFGKTVHHPGFCVNEMCKQTATTVSERFS